MDLRLTQLYTLIGTFITRLTVTPFPPSVSARRHVPTASSYEKRIMRPRKVGGSVEGSGRVYVSAGRMSAHVFCWKRVSVKRHDKNTHNSDSPQGSRSDQQPTSQVGLQIQEAALPPPHLPLPQHYPNQIPHPHHQTPRSANLARALWNAQEKEKSRPGSTKTIATP